MLKKEPFIVEKKNVPIVPLASQSTTDHQKEVAMGKSFQQRTAATTDFPRSLQVALPYAQYQREKKGSKSEQTKPTDTQKYLNPCSFSFSPRSFLLSLFVLFVFKWMGGVLGKPLGFELQTDYEPIGTNQRDKKPV
jgi:hypothetical protein